MIKLNNISYPYIWKPKLGMVVNVSGHCILVWLILNPSFKFPLLFLMAHFNIHYLSIPKIKSSLSMVTWLLSFKRESKVLLKILIILIDFIFCYNVVNEN
jgi:hypothetical protein